MKKRLGIITVGGDCSGLNSSIRAATIRAELLGHELIGIKRGFFGLFPENCDTVTLSTKNCGEDLLSESGSILFSDTKSFTTCIERGHSQKETLQMVCDGYKKLSLDGLIYIGGDGSLTILGELLNHALDLIKVVAIPKTIDNDVSMTSLSLGFSTAVEGVVNSISSIRSTAKSHQRAMVVEVMGRDAGFIALYAGLASGADIILVPEFEYDMEKVVARVERNYALGKKYCIIVVAEAVESEELKHRDGFFHKEAQSYGTVKYKGIGQHISDYLNDKGFESRAITLGHVQRGGATAVADRIVGTAFGTEAVNSLLAGEGSIMLSYRDHKIEKILIPDLLRNINNKLDKSDLCVKVALDLGVYIGELCQS
ncbi:MAG: ATP-dependent 6-phosphofructokinase [Holosporales bacterium]|jgi:6-phosphofructokinase 1|nr:ATP-dependent 6-phosphofructokinase [Holosporales bacterium]